MNRSFRKIIGWIIGTVLLAVSIPVHATDIPVYHNDINILKDSGSSGSQNDTTWQEDYSYSIFFNYMLIEGYKGDLTTIHIPAEARIDNVVYKTAVNGNIAGATSSDHNSSIKSISFDDGVEILNCIFL